jgi:hypothetical protein
LQVGESTMAIKDGFRLERICVGAQEKWRVSRYEEILSYTHASLYYVNIHIYIHELCKLQDVFANKEINA